MSSLNICDDKVNKMVEKLLIAYKNHTFHSLFECERDRWNVESFEDNEPSNDFFYSIIGKMRDVNYNLDVINPFSNDRYLSIDLLVLLGEIDSFNNEVILRGIFQ